MIEVRTEGFQPDEMPAVERAFATWTAATGVKFDITHASDAMVSVEIVPSTDPALLNYGGVAYYTYNAAGTLTDFDVLLGDIYVSWGFMPGGGGYELLLHEIGHGFLEHTDTASVMNVDDTAYYSRLVPKDVQSLAVNYDVTGGAEGDDTVTGAERLFGFEGDDTIYGGVPDNVIYGNQGADQVYGNQGDDALFGGAGDDLLFGGQGADTLYAGRGADTLWGGKGADAFMADDLDAIADFNPAEGDVLI
jgi:hypothetical protein